jgi:hypothetical protein
MQIEQQDHDLTLGMREILAFAKRRLPESIICLFSFTQAADESPISINKVATNSREREGLTTAINEMLLRMATAEVTDLTDTIGGMQ